MRLKTGNPARHESGLFSLEKQSHLDGGKRQIAAARRDGPIVLVRVHEIESPKTLVPTV
jgi:hypothetical protein